MKKMKKMISILLLLIPFIGISQNVEERKNDSIVNYQKTQLAFSVGQDVRLAAFGDSDGNERFTTDVNFRLEVRRKKENFDLVAAQMFEYADYVDGEFFRYSINVGLNLRNSVKNMEFTPTVGYGVIHTGDDNYGSFGANLQTTYLISDWFGIFIDTQFNQRPDLIGYGSSAKFSGKFGFKFYL